MSRATEDAIAAREGARSKARKDAADAEKAEAKAARDAARAEKAAAEKKARDDAKGDES